MLDDFIHAFLIVLAEDQIVNDLSIKDKIVNDLINSEDDFNHVALQYEETEWLYPLPQSCCTSQKTEKVIDIKNYL